MPPQKPNKKLIGVIIAIVAIVVVLLVVLLLFAGGLGGGSAGDFVGTWSVDSYVMNGEIDTVPADTTITFLSDGTYTASGTSGSGTWEVRNNKINIASPTGGGDFDDVGLDYSFSDFNNKVTISYSGYVEEEFVSLNMVLTRN